MIPVAMQPEPDDFDQKVRQPGTLFLNNNPHPTDWTNREYWRECLSELHKLYGGVCAYCAHWIPLDTGVPTTDHYLPISKHPELAYEWSNFRLAALRYNSRKHTHPDVLDPFIVQKDWFIVEFPSFLVKPHPDLPTQIANQVSGTIKRLGLCDDLSIRARESWVEPFYKGVYPLSFLESRAPFLAYELIRQQLDDADLLRRRFKPLDSRPAFG